MPMTPDQAKEQNQKLVKELRQKYAVDAKKDIDNKLKLHPEGVHYTTYFLPYYCKDLLEEIGKDYENVGWYCCLTEVSDPFGGKGYQRLEVSATPITHKTRLKKFWKSLLCWGEK